MTAKALAAAAMGQKGTWTLCALYGRLSCSPSLPATHVSRRVVVVPTNLLRCCVCAAGGHHASAGTLPSLSGAGTGTGAGSGMGRKHRKAVLDEEDWEAKAKHTMTALSLSASAAPVDGYVPLHFLTHDACVLSRWCTNRDSLIFFVPPPRLHTPTPSPPRPPCHIPPPPVQ